jgi:hypothetical protein
MNVTRREDGGVSSRPDALVTVRPVAGVDYAGSIMTMTGARATAELIAEVQS